MKKIWIGICMLFILSACAGDESALDEADAGTNVSVLKPVQLNEDWELQQVVEDDNLIVSIYEHAEKGTVELIQDQQIQGLDPVELRDYLNDGNWAGDLNNPADGMPLAIHDYVGEWTSLSNPEERVQYTFVRQFDLFQTPAEGLSYYQVIGQNVSESDVIEFVEALDRVQS
ncbi:hypothetical protein [Alkalicoccus luteus]|uniref:hypothetical protein n=1 Tax=Alkalicoccus luteus TaxID=1237094 RepID=UPI004033215B